MKNIVVLDDSLTIHKIVEYSIDPDKYKLYKIFTIEDFNSKLKDIDIHLLLLDNKLEGINVKDFCKNLKETNKNIKIILLVGAFERLDPKDFAMLNIDDFINKPFNSKILSEKIESLMGGVPSYVEKGFGEKKDRLDKIDYERLLEELEPITSQYDRETGEDGGTEEDETTFDELENKESKKGKGKNNKMPFEENVLDFLDEDGETEEVIEGERDETTLGELENEENEIVREKNKRRSFEENVLDFLEDDEDIKTMRNGYRGIERVEELKAELEKKLKKDIESIDFQKIGIPLMEDYIIQNLKKIDFEKYIIPLIEKTVNEILTPKLEDMFQEILEKIVTTLVPDIAEKLIREEIENIKKGKIE